MRVTLHRHVQLDEITATISKISTLESARAQEMLTDFGIASFRSSGKNRSPVDEWALIRISPSPQTVPLGMGEKVSTQADVSECDMCAPCSNHVPLDWRNLVVHATFILYVWTLKS